MSDFPKSGIKYSGKNIKGTLIAEVPTSIGSAIKGDCKIGYMSYIGGSSEIYSTHIGRFCSIAVGFVSGPTNHPIDRLSSHLFTFSNYGPFKGCEEYEKWMRSPILAANNSKTYIGNDVWIGRNVTVRRGIKIGDGAIIGAGSVVVKDVAPYTMVGGVPAKEIRKRFSDEIISRLITLQWHNYKIDKDVVPDLDVADIDKALSKLEGLIEKGLIPELSPKTFRLTSSGMFDMNGLKIE